MSASWPHAQEFFAAIRKYCDAVLPDSQRASPSDKEISIILTGLIALGEKLPNFGELPDKDPPCLDYNYLCRQIGARFPNYGFYASATPIGDNGQPNLNAGVSDTINDLADIFIDLSTTVKISELESADSGIAYARLLFCHWGAHAINLKQYLHQRLYGFS